MHHGTPPSAGWLRAGTLVVAALAVLCSLAAACRPQAPAGSDASGAAGGATGPATSSRPSASAPGNATNAPEGQGSASAAGQATSNAPATPTQPVKLRVAYSEVFPGATIPWTTYEAGLFTKNGLDAELTYIASANTVPAVLAGEVDVALGGGYAVINSRLAGSDLKMFLGVVNWYQYELMVNSEIQSPADLKGKRLGVSRFGSASDQATRVALQQFGLVPDQDVIIIQTGSMQERVAAMQAGAVAGGVASPPDPLRLRRLGFNSLMDMARSGLQDLNTIAFAQGSWLNAQEPTAQAFTNAMIEGIHFAKTNPEFTKQVLRQYLKMDDQELLDVSYDYYTGQNLARVPDPGRDAIGRYLESQAATDPRAVGARVEDFVDLRFINRVESSGLVQQLYGSN
jgi:ABC-type nitrate/sulfonate/bicarbonate transport system substrate-binding protein